MMEAILKRCAGVDVHKKSLTVCVRILEEGERVRSEVKTFGTMTRDLLALSDWLREREVRGVAMESTGVFWKPVYNILEEEFQVLLCNAKSLKHVPGRKSDVRDCEWIAQLHQWGLLKGSFIPPRAQRDLRDLTRTRAQLTSERTRHVNRIHKVLEDANVKLGVVATDILGKSGRDILHRLIDGEEDPKELSELARGRMRSKKAELAAALEGKIRDHHRFLLREHLKHIDSLEAEIEIFTVRIDGLIESDELSPPPPEEGEAPQESDSAPEKSIRPLSFSEAQELLVALPGFQKTSAQNLLAEIGTDMSVFPNHEHFASWAKLCPGTHLSAGKPKQVGIGNGNRWLRQTVSQTAWAASRTKGTYFSAQYKRLTRRRSKKKSIVAVGHSQLVTVYHMLRDHCAYEDLGADYFDQLNRDQILRYHVKRLESLGHEVTLKRLPEAA